MALHREKEISSILISNNFELEGNFFRISLSNDIASFFNKGDIIYILYTQLLPPMNLSTKFKPLGATEKTNMLKISTDAFISQHIQNKNKKFKV